MGLETENVELGGLASWYSWGRAVGGPFLGKHLSRFDHCNPCNPGSLPAGGGPAAGPLIKPQKTDVQGLDRICLNNGRRKNWVSSTKVG